MKFVRKYIILTIFRIGKSGVEIFKNVVGPENRYTFDFDLTSTTINKVEYSLTWSRVNFIHLNAF